MGLDDLHDTVDHFRSGHDLLRQREHRPELIGGSEEVGVVHRRDEKRLGQDQADLLQDIKLLVKRKLPRNIRVCRVGYSG